MKIFSTAILIAAVFGLGFNSCKKDKNNKHDTGSLTQVVNDDNRIKAADDEILNDVNKVLSGGLKSTNAWPCNATIDSSSVVNDTITYYITFNGLNCHGNFNRVGQAEARKNVNVPWSQAGSKVYVKYINVAVTRVATGVTATLNGTRVLENVSGGTLNQIGSGISTVVHKASGSMDATFSDNTTRTWVYSRQRTFTGTYGDLTCTVDGLGSDNGYSNLTSWGLTRSNSEFYVQITQSVIHKESCGWDPVYGIKIYQIPAESKKATVTFGFDDNNQPVPLNSGSCPTRCRVDWEMNGNTGTLFIQI